MPIVLVAALLLAGCKGGGVIIPEETDENEDSDTNADTDTDVADLDADDDGHDTPADCNDADPNVHPGASETCNGIDDDCDDAIDEDAIDVATFYADADADGHGALLVTTTGCSAPTGYVTTSDDCNDANADVHPGADEVCNALDDNCNAQVDETLTFKVWYVDSDGDGYGDASDTIVDCMAPFGRVEDGTDCYDDNAEVYPGAIDWHTVDRGDLSFDFDCSASEEQQWPDTGICYGWGTSGAYMEAGFRYGPLDCGEAGEFGDSISDTFCTVPWREETQGCR